jgi:hypothetical protein
MQVRTRVEVDDLHLSSPLVYGFGCWVSATAAAARDLTPNFARALAM